MIYNYSIHVYTPFVQIYAKDLPVSKILKQFLGIRRYCQQRYIEQKIVGGVNPEKSKFL